MSFSDKHLQADPFVACDVHTQVVRKHFAKEVGVHYCKTCDSHWKRWGVVKLKAEIEQVKVQKVGECVLFNDS